MTKLCKDCKYYKFEHLYDKDVGHGLVRFWARYEEQCHHPAVVDRVNGAPASARVQRNTVRYTGQTHVCGVNGAYWRKAQ